MGLATSVVWFTFAKLIPAELDGDGRVAVPARWQSYINRVENSAGDPVDNGDFPGNESPDVLDQAVQATNDNAFAGGSLVELSPGNYRYTFGNDVTNITSPIAVAWEPSLIHRVGLEIRLGGEGEVPLAPFNPVYDFIPATGLPTTASERDVAATENCNACHFEFALHGGPRKSVEYCVTCHNAGTYDEDTGEALDMAYLAHSIHMGEDRASDYVIYGYGGSEHDYSEVTYPQSKTFCETCHDASNAANGDAWNEVATAKTCGGCHVDGLVADFRVSPNPDPTTGQLAYAFDHAAAGADGGFNANVQDGECSTCHLTNGINTAGPALAIHSRISGDQRFAYELGKDFVFEILDVRDGAADDPNDDNDGYLEPGEVPRIQFRITDSGGTPYTELPDGNVRIYVAWTTDDIYNGDENGDNLGWREQSDALLGPGLPHRLEDENILDYVVSNVGGTFTVDYFRAVPEDITGHVVVAMAGHPEAKDVENADGDIVDEDSSPVSKVVYVTGNAPGQVAPLDDQSPRQVAFTAETCNACHKHIEFHGGNRNGDPAVCLICHTAENATDDDGGFSQDYSFAMGYMIHEIHSADADYADGEFAHVTYPQSVANCETCHVGDSYNVAREKARAVSTDGGASEEIWTDDTATTPSAAACGACHSSQTAKNHFATVGGAQVDALKSDIEALSPWPGIPTGQEGCGVCHGAGSIYDTAQFHNPGVED
jgi:OmcA/MtrC family decaheme c-type cytochrome